MATHTTRSIVKAFDLLQIVCGLPRSASLRDVAAEADMSLATTHRILTTLRRVGAVRVAPDGGYELGSKLVDLRARDIVEADDAREVLAGRLRAATLTLGMSTRFATLDDQGMLSFIAGVDSGKDSSGLSRVVGASFEGYFHAAGKLLLAGLPADKLTEYLFSAPLVAVAPKTITDPKRLAAELRHAAVVGYALEDEEFVSNEQAFAVPVRGEGGKVIAALSASRRLAPLNDVGEVLRVLRGCAQALEEDLAHEPRGARTVPWLAELQS